jgi:hypothetical protein
MRSFARHLALSSGVIAACVLSSLAAWAQPPSPDLLARLAEHAEKFERMKKRISFDVSGQLQTLDSDGKVDGTKALVGHLESDGKEAKFTIVRYTEDGEDKTDEAKKKQREREVEKRKEEAKGGRRELRMPFHVYEQPRYTFDQIEIDKADPTRVRISFVPKIREEDTFEGSAWVDTKSGMVLSAGFKLSRTPMFVDYVHFTVVFGAPTALAPAVSRVSVDGKGGILFLRKRFHGEAVLTNHRLAP